MMTASAIARQLPDEVDGDEDHGRHGPKPYLDAEAALRADTPV